MIDRKAFFEAVRNAPFSGHLTQGQVDGLDAMLTAGAKLPLEHLAYCMATAWWETDQTMQPVTENLNYTTAARIRAVWPSRFPSIDHAAPYAGNPQKLANKVYGGRMGNRDADDGWRYRGRGFVQITGRDNYERASRALDVNLVKDPDKAREPAIAAAILFSGMSEGWFTGRKLADYFGAGKNDPVHARAIINPDGNGAKIAIAHRELLSALQAAYRPGDDPAPPSPVPQPQPQPAPAPEPPKGFWAALLASLFNR